MGLETQSGKSRLPDPPRAPLMCCKHSPCHAFYTSQRVPPGSLWPPFWLPFGHLWRPKVAQGPKKTPSKKTLKKGMENVPQSLENDLRNGLRPVAPGTFFSSPDPSSPQMGPRPHFGSILGEKLLIFCQFGEEFCGISCHFPGAAPLGEGWNWGFSPQTWSQIGHNSALSRTHIRNIHEDCNSAQYRQRSCLPNVVPKRP